MRKNRKKWIATVMSGILCAMIFSGCAAEEPSVSSEKINDSQPDSLQSDGTSEKNSDETPKNTVGEFSTQDVYGNAYTQDIFMD